ncbi:MAG: XRE family transcriptional regulator [Armatimonadota bacterium]|nr:XRE family transcriptional regulator [Armatimonadota bacterium]
MGLTQHTACELTKIGISSLSEFENGKREPSLSQIGRLASVYKKPIAFFLEEETPRPETILWRERPTERAEAIEGEFLELCRRYSNLERWCHDAVTPDLPHVTLPRSAFNFARAEELARRVRNELSLGDRPAFSLLQVLEDRCGVKIFHRDIEPTGTAAAVKSERYGWAILLNSRNAQVRRNFDLAHELFHLLTWEAFQHDQEQPQNAVDAEEERFANAFASSLLMPEEEMESAVERRRRDGKLALAAVTEIAHQFRVSSEAALWRIHRLYGLDAEMTQESIQRLRDASLSRQTPDEDGEQAQRLPGRYQDLAQRALHDGELSVRRFAEYMGISAQEAMRYNEMSSLDAEITLVAA